MRSADVTTPTERSVKNDVMRVSGSSGCSPAWARVPAQSTDSPDATGSISLVASPTDTGTGRVVRGSISVRSRCSASASGRPPTSTPATTTPRGTLPEVSSRSPA
ncbi:hypothetical protein BJF78_34515 [Pseudonocardia sp. CNS-139]|nr:hypothetical protein BJF78_34515 [Pseudonocardia sp. CNS-139]